MRRCRQAATSSRCLAVPNRKQAGAGLVCVAPPGLCTETSKQPAVGLRGTHAKTALKSQYCRGAPGRAATASRSQRSPAPCRPPAPPDPLACVALGPAGPARPRSGPIASRAPSRPTARPARPAPPQLGPLGRRKESCRSARCGYYPRVLRVPPDPSPWRAPGWPQAGRGPTRRSGRPGGRWPQYLHPQTERDASPAWPPGRRGPRGVPPIFIDASAPRAPRHVLSTHPSILRRGLACRHRQLEAVSPRGGMPRRHPAATPATPASALTPSA